MDRNPGPSRGNTPSRGRAGTRSRSQSASAATLSGQFMVQLIFDRNETVDS